MKEFILEWYGALIVGALLFWGYAQAMLVIFLARKDRLIERERIVAEAFQRILFENERTEEPDGFIFGSLWRVSDIHKAANALGYELTLVDVVAVVASIKRDFDKEQGVNDLVIELAISEYIKHRDSFLQQVC